MELFQIVILAIVQAFTEWLPVSSSGHLALFQNLFSIQNPIGFDVLLHVASILALIIFIRKEIASIFVKIAKGDFKLLFYIILASIPAGLLGVLFGDYVEKAFSSLLPIAIGFFITSIALFSTKFIRKDEKLNWKKSFLIGLFQAIAIFPGISRSGLTITGGMYAGLNKEKAFKFSLLLAIPVVLGAFILKIKEISFSSSFLIGFIICGLLSYLSLMIFAKIVKKGKIHYFGYYCLALALLILVYFLIT